MEKAKSLGHAANDVGEVEGRSIVRVCCHVQVFLGNAAFLDAVVTLFCDFVESSTDLG